jgi:DNA helicase-2/ATP-dependent DNA helicase PcrA
VHRLVRLVESGVPAESILLLTFTRRAAEEMIERAASILGRREPVAGGTFHSFANLALRRYGKAIGLPPGFTILDQSDSFEILGEIRAELKDTAEGETLPRRETIAAILSKSVNKLAPIEDVVSEEFEQFFSLISLFEVAASRYRAYKSERHFVDFDDLLVLLIRLLEESPKRRSASVPPTDTSWSTSTRTRTSSRRGSRISSRERRETSWWSVTTPRASTRSAAPATGTSSTFTRASRTPPW